MRRLALHKICLQSTENSWITRSKLDTRRLRDERETIHHSCKLSLRYCLIVSLVRAPAKRNIVSASRFFVWMSRLENPFKASINRAWCRPWWREWIKMISDLTSIVQLHTQLDVGKHQWLHISGDSIGGDTSKTTHYRRHWFWQLARLLILWRSNMKRIVNGSLRTILESY